MSRLYKILDKMADASSEPTTILGFGTYNAVGDYNVENIEDYRFLIFRLGSSTNLAAGGGSQFAIFPTSILKEYNSDAVQGVNYYLNGRWYNIVFYFKSATVMHIQIVRNITDGNATMASGIRQIIGIK